MECLCPNCGFRIALKGTGGRKPSNVSLIMVCDALRKYATVREAATALDCSRALVYKVLKMAGLTVKDARQ